MTTLPAPGARIQVLQSGAVGPRVRSSVILVTGHERIVVVDPGMAPSQEAILGPLADAGVGRGDVTDVVMSHHHPDHTVNVGLFGAARIHDHWAVYHHDVWTSRPADGFAVTPSVVLWETPGHTPQDITTLVATDEGIVACTHLWWHEQGPAEDPLASDPAALHNHRRRVLEVADLVVPGHGPPFVPGDTTPR